MSRTVTCAKLQRDLPALPFKPFDNELGQRLFDEVSMEAWKMWLEHSKMIVNEFRLDLTTKKAHEVLLEQCEAFFFGDGAALPPDFVAPPSK